MKNDIAQLDNNRFLFLDVLKVIALIIMPIIHVLSYASRKVIFSGDIALLEMHESVLYYFTPGIFIFCMGCGLVLSRHSEPIDLYKRGLKLLLVGLLLNVFRASLLFSILGSIVDKIYYQEAVGWLWGSDVLYFDGLFFLMMALLKKLNMKDWMILVFAIILSIISGVFFMAPTNNFTIDLLLGNIIRIDESSFFPIVSWTIWPVLGYLFFKAYVKVEDKDKYVLNIGVISAILFVVFLAFLFVTNIFKERYIWWGGGDFIIDIPTTILTLGVEGVYICLIYFLVKLIKNQNIISVITWISRKVNAIYVVHWLIITWTYNINKYTIVAKTQSIIVLYIIGLLVFILSAFIVKGMERLSMKNEVKILR